MQVAGDAIPVLEESQPLLIHPRGCQLLRDSGRIGEGFSHVVEGAVAAAVRHGKRDGAREADDVPAHAVPVPP
jgi:hypothetical protein